MHPLFWSGINENWIFPTVFLKILKHKISWKSVQWEPICSMRMEIRTYRHDEANSRFSQLCDSAYKYELIIQTCITTRHNTVYRAKCTLNLFYTFSPTCFGCCRTIIRESQSFEICWHLALYCCWNSTTSIWQYACRSFGDSLIMFRCNTDYSVHITRYIFFSGSAAQRRLWPPRSRGFVITHNAPLDEWSARRRDPCLTSHNTHNKQTSMPPVGFESTIAAGKRP
jgi:hypothetical protein